MSKTVLEIEQLSKWYGSVQALNNLSLKISQGSVYGILGPNGSGKTTLLGIVLGVILPSKGHYQWGDGSISNASHRQNMGALLEQPNFYPYLSGEDNLKICARIKGVNFSEVDRVLEKVGLEQRRKSKYKTYSTGMQQRLAMGAALLGDPDLLILDEPTSGLDPQGIAYIRNIILDIAKQQKTIILASHLLDEIEKVCSHVAILREGELLSTGEVDKVLTPADKVELQADDTAQLKEILDNYDKVKEVNVSENKIMATVDKSLKPAELNKHLAQKGVYLSHLSYQKQSLEEHFLALMEEKNV